MQEDVEGLVPLLDQGLDRKEEAEEGEGRKDQEVEERVSLKVERGGLREEDVSDKAALGRCETCTDDQG